MQHAHESWQALREQPRFAPILTPHEIEWIRHLIPRIGSINRMIQSLPFTLCHGDCHTANVVHDSAGQFVWVDWQEVRIGRGVEDVAFFLERASIAGARISYDTALTMYQKQLEAETGEALSLTEMYRGIRAAELRSRVLYWPAYLAQASEQQLTKMVQHLHVLADQLEI